MKAARTIPLLVCALLGSLLIGPGTAAAREANGAQRAVGVKLPPGVSQSWWSEVRRSLDQPAILEKSQELLPRLRSWSAQSNQEFANFGWSVATAGDVNADGYDDVIVGAPQYDHGQIDEGGAAEYAGHLSAKAVRRP